MPGSVLIVLAALVLPGQTPPSSAAEPAEAAPRARSHTVLGEVVRLDLERRAITVKLDGEPPRELRLRLTDETRLVRAGRAVRLEDVEAGERAMATCSDDAEGRHEARLVKLGSARHAAPEPEQDRN